MDNTQQEKRDGIPEALKSTLSDYFVSQPEPLREALTIQIVMARNVLDYMVLRTEDTRELNTAATPLSVDNPEPELRVVFLGGKQKAAETRKLGDILRTANRVNNRNPPVCFLKDKLCMHCPRCALFGAVTVKGGNQDMNFKHRIEYSSAFSLLPYEDIEESLTFNATDEATTRVGQALGETPSVAPANIFPSIVTLNTVTWKEFVLAMKTLLATKSYGAEGRTKGDAHNVILGIAAGWEEIISPLELTLELYKVYADNKAIDGAAVRSILNSYKQKSAFVNRVAVLNTEQVSNICRAIQEFELTEEFLNEAYQDVETFLNKASASDKPQSVSASPKVRKGK
jgi:CRISPR type I-D-associated protein Csc2